METIEMDEACQLRLQLLERDSQEHEKEIRAQGDTLNSIVKTLSQIRWMGMGALGFFVTQNIGLVEAIKKIIGL